MTEDFMTSCERGTKSEACREIYIFVATITQVITGNNWVNNVLFINKLKHCNCLWLYEQ